MLIDLLQELQKETNFSVVELIWFKTSVSAYEAIQLLVVWPTSESKQTLRTSNVKESFNCSSFPQ